MLPEEANHRGLGKIAHVDAGYHIGNAGAGGAEADAGFAGHTAVTIGHEGAALLMSDVIHLDILRGNGHHELPDMPAVHAAHHSTSFSLRILATRGPKKLF